MNILAQYYPELDSSQIDQLESLIPLYKEWNSKINVVSRKDIDHLMDHHILHSLLFKKFIDFLPGSKIFDLGCGGGFPGIPLAIIFPKVNFHLLDARAKKITVVQDICNQLELSNVTSEHGRVEEHKGQYDFVITRAVALMSKLYTWSKPLIAKENKHQKRNGILALKGGNINEEYKAVRNHLYMDVLQASAVYGEPYYAEKALVHLYHR